MQERALHLDGRLVAHAAITDPFGYDHVEHDHVYLFKGSGGYELITLRRNEHYRDDEVSHGDARITSMPLATVSELASVVASFWPSGEVWSQLLEHGRDNDPDLLAAWIPEQMRRELDRSSLYDQGLATTSGYLNGQGIAAPGRHLDGWREQATWTVGALLSDRGWTVRPGPELSPGVPVGGLLSGGTEIVGTLWATRYDQEVALIIRVDDAGEIYPRLAEPNDVLVASGLSHPGGRAEGVAPSERAGGDPRLLSDALERFVSGQCNDHGFGLGL